MSESHECMITVLCFAKDAEATLKQSIQLLNASFASEKYSSIYKVFGERASRKSIHDLRTRESFNGLCVCVRGQTSLPAKELMATLKSVEAELNKVKNQTLWLYLLAYDDNVVMTPGLTLPNPGLHESPQLLIPAAEVWPTYRHPVLNDTLLGLSKGAKINMWGEFHAQAKTLLDF